MTRQTRKYVLRMMRCEIVPPHIEKVIDAMETAMARAVPQKHLSVEGLAIMLQGEGIFGPEVEEHGTAEVKDVEKKGEESHDPYDEEGVGQDLPGDGQKIEVDYYGPKKGKVIGRGTKGKLRVRLADGKIREIRANRCRAIKDEANVGVNA